MIRSLFHAASVALLLAAPLSHAEEMPPSSDPTKTMLVFDASGSMWGQLDGTAKIDIARDALGSVLKNWDTIILISDGKES